MESIIGPQLPPTVSDPTFLQIYFMEGRAADQVVRRSRINDGLRPEIILYLQESLQTDHL